MGEVNPWLAEKIKGMTSPSELSLIVEAQPSALQTVLSRLRALSGLRVGPTAFNMIQVAAPPKAIPLIASLPGVIFVHYNMPVGIRAAPKIIDPLMGKFELSSVTIPFSPAEMALRFGPSFAWSVASFPFRMASALLGIRTPLGQIQQPGVIILTTGEVRKMLKVPEDNKMFNTRVAVLDTGVTYPLPVPPPLGLLHLTKGFIQMESTTGEPYLDGLGHGQWCLTAAFGDSAQTRFGLCQGVADPENGTIMSVKCLTNLGFGTEFTVISAMEKAVKWGAKVVSMSLGGELQGDVDSDPECRVIKATADRVIWVVAAGNDGPDEWTIGSPAASPYAVTVGAWSPHYGGLAVFSSRGPNAPWYRDNPSKWEADFSKYGENLIKPDLVAPGGGPVKEGDPADLILSGVTGWMDGAYDLTPLDGTGPMRGTSMATPMAAGLISLAVERGLIATAEDVKRKMARGVTKDHQQGYGFITWDRLT